MCRIFAVLTPVMGLVLALTDVALAERPNVIVIMTDDQGVGDFGFAGNQLVDTPHLDALYKGGVHLEEFLCQSRLFADTSLSHDRTV